MSAYGLGILATTISIHQYMKFQKDKIEESVYNRMEVGSKPVIPHRDPKTMIPREELAREMVKLFFPFSGESSASSNPKFKNTFGLIVGPSGTGKSALVTKECNRLPKGVLYHNVCEPKDFARELAEAVGMKIGPSNILDLLLGYFSSDIFVYYHLPENQDQAVNLIFKTLSKAANRFKATHAGNVPTLFIDGSDVLCKFENELFMHLLYQAKELANAEQLTIVFVSSEGSILPLIQESSTSSRSIKVFEVLDIPDEIAIKDLEINGLSKVLSKMFVDYAGGRFVYLNGCKMLHAMYKGVHPGMDDNLLYKKIKEDLFLKKLNNQQCAIEKTKPTSQKLLTELSIQGEIIPSHFYGMCDIEKVIANLIGENVLRYTSKGLIMWHGRPQRLEFEIKEAGFWSWFRWS